ncbi:TRAP transporter large permease [Pseudovibrio sp. Tun.PSC04-5.I4]|uniref:TRAP transporter large permease n=1 Tax=Pseudovibrio sp. Tun.PSC04-5.I4 TaxID=1798213 RepID=UPI0008896624|nr:TRAP transporter large permease [Pseudovibrio sp. Tun.PSC04-5.I4]SDQ15468.1 TRAP transporter, DctM subunit [Pseudovibrio sp. Tun.PSC04-5.I4]
MEWYVAFALFGSFFFLVFTGVPIAFSLGVSAIVAGAMMMPIEVILAVISQRMVAGLDSFALLAIPFFILAGVLMNSGGIAIRLIRFSQILVGRMPGSLAHVNIMANMLFGSISGSATAAAAAVGGTMAPLQKEAGYHPAYSAAVNVTSCITGLLIPPSNVLIIYALTAGGVSVATLFMAGYLPGILMGLSLMTVGSIIAKRRGYPVAESPTFKQALKVTWDAIPSLLLVIIVMGGILGGVFTATEASAIAVVYAFFLSVIVYREIKPRQLPKLLLDAVVTTSIVLVLIAISIGMSWVMTRADIPYMITDALLAVSENPFVILLIINVILLIVGVFMDMTPAVLIFTPIFLPIAKSLGMDPVHFGIMLVANLCIGLCTPPVGAALFVGCSVSGVKLHEMIRPMLPFFGALLVALMAIIYIPELSLFLPNLFGMH